MLNLLFIILPNQEQQLEQTSYLSCKSYGSGSQYLSDPILTTTVKKKNIPLLDVKVNFIKKFYKYDKQIKKNNLDNFYRKKTLIKSVIFYKQIRIWDAIIRTRIRGFVRTPLKEKNPQHWTQGWEIFGYILAGWWIRIQVFF